MRQWSLWEFHEARLHSVTRMTMQLYLEAILRRKPFLCWWASFSIDTCNQSIMNGHCTLRKRMLKWCELSIFTDVLESTWSGHGPVQAPFTICLRNRAPGLIQTKGTNMPSKPEGQEARGLSWSVCAQGLDQTHDKSRALFMIQENLGNVDTWGPDQKCPQ